MTPETPSSAPVGGPFGKIALCLSGGGYRAATYALGTIDMLEQLGLLDSVKVLSTVSGGTFTGVSYATSIALGKSYAEFYADLYKFIKKTNCIDLALERLYSTPSPSGRDDPSLIRAAANVYEERLFGGRDLRFQTLMDLVGPDKRFLELIHNATEFRKGNSFRMRASHDAQVYAGNGDFRVAPAVAAEFRLADIVAASSCFPAAFEPLRFPEDFVWTSGLRSIRRELMQDIDGEPSGYNVDDKCISLPLMDGGIYDNQGITNAVMADNIKPPPNYDLFIIADTTARSNYMMRYPRPDKKDGWLSINLLYWLAVLLFAVSFVSAIMLGYFFYSEYFAGTLTWPRTTFQFVVPISLFIVLMGLLNWIYRLFKKNKEVVVAGVKFQLWDAIKSLSLPDFINMAKARFTSLGTMSGDVFMKRVRQLQFNVVLGNPPKFPTKYSDKVAFDLIYDLNPTLADDVWKVHPILEPTPGMKALSKKAEAIQTTLWFKPGSSDQDTLVACGQVTTCYSLLRYLWRVWDRKSKVDRQLPRPDDSASAYYDIHQKLVAKWMELREKYP
jgi:predicted acylesterase/phospholipase RssA